MQELDEFTRAYIEAALWSSHDESRDDGGDPFDKNYSEDDLSIDALKEITIDCANFQASAAFIAAEAAGDAATCRNRNRDGEHYSVYAQAGHDFWLTRNGHGTGFWDDGRWNEPHKSDLDALAKTFRERDLYLGDDGKIHIS